MEQSQTQNPLGTQPLNKLIMQFAIPATISMLVGSLYNVVDQIFLGQAVGLYGNAATTVSFPVLTVCIAVALLVGIGAASNYNLKSGAGDEKLACRFAGNGLFFLCALGLVVAVITLIFLKPLLYVFGATEAVMPYAVDYLGITAIGFPFLVLTVGGNHLIRADKSPTYSMVCMVSGAVLNTILNPILMFGFGWGVKGSAVATVISQAFSAFLVIFYFAKLRKMELSRADFMPRFSIFKMIAALGFASFVNQIAIGITQTVANNMLKHYGELSAFGADIPVASAGVVSKLSAIFLAFCIGIAQGCQPIWGFNRGAGNFKRVRQTYKKAVLLVLGVGIVFFLIFEIYTRQMLWLFGEDSDAFFEFAEKYMRIFLAFTIFNGLQPMSSGFFTSIGKAKLGALIGLTRQIFLLVPMLLIFPLFWGVEGIMFAGPISDFIAVAVAVVLAAREIKTMKQKEANRLAGN
ncbi:MAG: MATE family efflux transporter [Oscillospiraceae bacterium]|jgi:putative MATE family efflux protein|nr:MATE family efflux transporter [Oscillospiraceae bacterium]